MVGNIIDRMGIYNFPSILLTEIIFNNNKRRIGNEKVSRVELFYKVNKLFCHLELFSFNNTLLFLEFS